MRPAVNVIRSVLTSRIGSMAGLLCDNELAAMGKNPDTLSTEDLDAYIMRLVEAVSPLLGRTKAREAGNEMSAAALSVLYGVEGGTGGARVHKFKVVQAYIIYSDGRLIAHNAEAEDSGLDKDIVSSMLTAVQNFVAESLGKDDTGALDELRYGNTKILIARETDVSMAVVVTGEQFEPVRTFMAQALKDVTRLYGPVLKDWSGNLAVVQGIQYYLDVLCLSGPIPLEAVEMPVEAASPSPHGGTAEETSCSDSINVASELEFYGGFIRLKIGVKNRMSMVITNVTLRISYDEGAFRYDHVEPIFDFKGGDVLLGNIGAGEKKSMALFLDPLICMDSYIDGLLTYRDASGNLDTVKMKRKLVSVVCPMLFTNGEMNVAMLKRMVEAELHQQDTRAFKIPPDMTGETALAIARAAVGRHDLKMIREFRRKGEPFAAELWFHARIKGREEKVVVRTSIIKDAGVMELFVASESLLVITGLLAELRHDVSAELEKRGLPKESLQQITDKNALTEVLNRVPLLMQGDPAEFPPGETEQR